MNDWFRSWHGAPTDPKWLTIAKRAAMAPGFVVSIAWALMDRASQSEDRGSIAGIDLETLADFMGCDLEGVQRIVDAMHDKGMLDGNRFVAWERRQPKREREDDTATERKRAQRARDKGRTGSDDGGTDDVTSGHDASHHVTPREEEMRLEKISTSLRSVEAPERARTPAPRTIASRIAPDWSPDLVDREYAGKQGLSDTEVDREADKFRDYWLAKPGRDGQKQDWRATWRTWCRGAVDRRVASSGTASVNGARAGPNGAAHHGRPISGARSAMAGVLSVITAQPETT